MRRDDDPPESSEALLETAIRAAEEAAELHRRELGRLETGAWTEKGTSDFVTEVDREAERLIVRRLRERFPGHAIVAEEGTTDGEGTVEAPEPAAAGSGAREAAAGPRPPAPPGGEVGPPVRWIIDPLDGTTNWLHAYPSYSVSVAAADRDGLRVAVVVDSARGERFEAVRGGGSRRDGEPIRVSAVCEPRLALLGTGFPFKRLDVLPLYLPMLERALRRTSGVRRAGSAALDLCHLACGRLDAFWELWLQPWDVAAGALIVWEAGGRFGPLRVDLPESARAGGEAEERGARELEEAVAGAREFVALCRGGAWDGRPPLGGAYAAANACLDDALEEILSGRGDA